MNETHKTISEKKEERRRYKRSIFNYKVEVHSQNGKTRVKCASFDISEGGIKVVTNVELKENAYVICIDNFKFNAHLMYEEARKSTMMDQHAYYHGFRFDKPVSLEIVRKLLKNAEKFRF